MRWLMQRWWFRGGAAFTLVAVVMGYLFIPVQQRISQANCDRIQLGWSLGQAKEVLGEPEEFVAEMSAPIRDWDAIVWQTNTATQYLHISTNVACAPRATSRASFHFQGN
jgi:hypothetical protein